MSDKLLGSLLGWERCLITGFFESSGLKTLVVSQIHMHKYTTMHISFQAYCINQPHNNYIFKKSYFYKNT